jgi:Flp pilus assembly protein TadB
MSGVAIATVAVAGATMYSAHQQKKATQRAADMQAQESQRQLKEQQQQFNRQNQNQVDVSGMLEGNSGGEMGTTLLTGAQGIAKDQLTLGKGSNLLGG